MKKLLSIDGIIAIESLLNQLDVLRGFNINQIIILEATRDVIKQETVREIFGIEDSGTVSLFVRPGSILKRFDMSDVLKISQSWENQNIYSIMIQLKKELLNISFYIAPKMITICCNS